MTPLISFLIFLPSFFCFIGLGKSPTGLIPLLLKACTFRKASILVFYLGAFFVLASSQAQADGKGPGKFSGKVSGVNSGHQLMVQEGDNTHKVNLYGILSPSKGAPQAEKARVFLEQIAFGRVVEVEIVPPSDPRRLYALVRLDGKNLNEEILRQGLAWVNHKACFLEVCKKWEALQEEAKAAGRGVWSDPSGTPPWEKGTGKRGKKKP